MDDDAVMCPKDEWETLVIRCFILSLESGINGIESNYLIVRDFSKKYAFDVIELYQIIKSMVGELNSGRK